VLHFCANLTRMPCGTHHLVRVKFQILRMTDGEKDGGNTRQGGVQVRTDAEVDQLFLVPEKPRPEMAGSRIGILALDFIPSLTQTLLPTRNRS
jgi:hypothetical protein